MPKIGIYVTEADKQFLDGLPEGIYGAMLMREAIARRRRDGEECAHPRAETVCPDCGWRDRTEAPEPADEPAEGAHEDPVGMQTG